MSPLPSPVNQVYNVAVGERTTFNELYAQLQRNLLPRYPHLQNATPVHRRLGYAPTQRIAEGLALAMPWYIGQAGKTRLPSTK